MKQRDNRHIAGLILLAVYLPILLVASLHTHTDSPFNTAECPQCESHQDCPGHITDAKITLHECVLCQFLTLPYMSATVLVAVIVNPTETISRGTEIQSVCRQVHGIVGLRAPPTPIA